MHEQRQFVAKVTLAIIFAFSGGVVFAALAHAAFTDPPPTVEVALDRILKTYGFGVSWAPALYFAALAVGLYGFSRLARWGYVLSLALLLLAALFPLNLLAITVAYLFVRLWPLYFSHAPGRFAPLPEWRQVLTAGFLAYAVFGFAVFPFSPQQQLERLRPTSVPPAPVAVLAADPRLVDRASSTLTAVRAIANVLIEEGPPYPVTERTEDLQDIRRAFSSYVQELIGALPFRATVGFWSDGTSFALFANLPVPFSHPRSLAAEPLPGTTLVRTDADVQDDLDFDGLTDLREEAIGTSPVLADTDGDGASDGLEIGQGTDPRIPNAL